MKGRSVVAIMAVVTAWSAWTFAQPHVAPHHPPPMTAPHEAREGAAGASEEHEHGPASINWTQFGTNTPPFVAVLVNFAILAAGYYLLGKKPIAGALVDRRNTISKQIDEATAMRKEAEARAKTYTDKLASLETEMATAREVLVRAGEAERDRVLGEATAKAERMQRDAEFMVQQEIKQLRLDLQRETVEAAVAAAEELLKRRITAADQERLADDYLADLGPKARTPGAAPSTRESAS